MTFKFTAQPGDEDRDPDEIILERAEELFLNSPQKFTRAEAIQYVLKQDPELHKRRIRKWVPWDEPEGL